MEKKNKKEIHIILKIAGIIFVLLGISGLFLPGIPGIPILIAGFLILGEESSITGWTIKKLPKPIRDKIQSLIAKRKEKQIRRK